MLLASTGPLEWLEQLELILSLEADVGCWPGPISIPHCPWLGPTSEIDILEELIGQEIAAREEVLRTDGPHSTRKIALLIGTIFLGLFLADVVAREVLGES